MRLGKLPRVPVASFPQPRRAGYSGPRRRGVPPSHGWVRLLWSTALCLLRAGWVRLLLSTALRLMGMRGGSRFRCVGLVTPTLAIVSTPSTVHFLPSLHPALGLDRLWSTFSIPRWMAVFGATPCVGVMSGRGVPDIWLYRLGWRSSGSARVRPAGIRSVGHSVGWVLVHIGWS